MTMTKPIEITVFGWHTQWGNDNYCEVWFEDNAIVDCTGLPNPGRNPTPEQLAELQQTPAFGKLVEHAVEYAVLAARVFVACAFGRHRSRLVAEAVARRLNENGYDVVIHLRSTGETLTLPGRTN